MAKVYPTPNPKPEKEGPGREPESQRRTVGTYTRPERRGPSKVMIVAVVIVAAIILVFLFNRYARGAAEREAGYSAIPGAERTVCLARPAAPAITPALATVMN